MTRPRNLMRDTAQGEAAAQDAQIARAIDEVGDFGPALFVEGCSAAALWAAGAEPGAFALDPTRVDVTSEWDILYWSRHFGIPPVDVVRAVEQIGDQPERVREWVEMQTRARQMTPGVNEEEVATLQ